LHDDYLLELANRFIVLSVSFFKGDNFFENHAGHNIDDDDSKGCAVDHALLEGIVISPVSAILGFIGLTLLCRELSERVIEDASGVRDQQWLAETTHQSKAILCVLLHVCPGSFLGRLVWTNGLLELGLQLLSLVLHDHDANQRRQHNRDCNDPHNSDASFDFLLGRA
jgi:hypothetical protein